MHLFPKRLKVMHIKLQQKNKTEIERGKTMKWQNLKRLTF